MQQIKAKVSTIAKYTEFLKAIVKIADANYMVTGEELYNLQRQHRINSTTVSIVVKLGFVTYHSAKQNVGKKRYNFYKVHLIKPEPKHAKQLLDYINKKRVEYRSPEPLITKPCDTSIKFQKEFKKPVKAKKPTIEQNTAVAKKEFSLLWGLLKIKY